MRGGPVGSHEHVVYYDWLKFLVVYGIVLYHASLPFAYGGWLLGSRDRTIVLTLFAGFTFPWGIALLFLISGAGAYFGLKSKSAIAFARKRLIRLGLPLVAGIATLSPLQSYVTNGITPKTLSGLLAYYPHFFHSITFDWTPVWLGRYSYHLWFLGDLLAISVFTLPLLEFLRGERCRRWVLRLASFSQRRGGLLVIAAPLALSQLLLRNRFPTYQDWADVATYTTVFLSGYIIAMESDFNKAIRSNGGLALKLGVVSSLVVGTMLALPNANSPAASSTAWTIYHATYNVFWALNIWSWCVVILWLGVRRMTQSNRIVHYGSESALPVYIVSHPVLVIFGSSIVAWSWPLWPRFLLLVAVGFAVTLLIYEFCIRRWTVTRFVFGLPPVTGESQVGAESADLSANAPDPWVSIRVESPR